MKRIDIDKSYTYSLVSKDGLILTFIMLLFIHTGVLAQWNWSTTTSNAIFYEGRVAIGKNSFTSGNQYKLEVEGSTKVSGSLTVKGKALFGLQGTNPNITNPNFNVFVEGGLITPEVAIASPDKWADYVFESGYHLAPLDSVENYINKNGHLPGIPSATEVEEKGYYSANDLAVKLLEKVEELTLYTIEQDKEIRRLLAELEKYKNQEKECGNKVETTH